MDLDHTTYCVPGPGSSCVPHHFRRWPMSRKLRFSALCPIFRGPFLERVAEGYHVDYLNELRDYFSPHLSPSLEHGPLSNWFDFFYHLLFSHYRCEYIYKNAIARLYLAQEDVQNSLLTSELRVGESRSDVVILNGTSTVYEIKSEYDSFERLDGQIADYRKVFDYIVVVTTQEKAELVGDQVPESVGVMSLTGQRKLDVWREPSSNKENVDPGTVFDCMRQAEFCEVVENEFGEVPKVPNSRIYREAKELFCQIEPSKAHDLMVKQLRRRGRRKPFVKLDLMKDTPHSLKHACLSFSKSQALAKEVKRRLTEPL